MKKGSLFVISGPSGTGKGTVCGEILKNKDNNLFLSVSTTSRDVREGEIPGITYNYTTPENFRAMAENGDMLEWAVYGGNYYGTPKKDVTDKLNEGKNVLLEIDVQGALNVKKSYNDAVLLFIAPPSVSELKRRLEERGRETEEQIDERIKIAEFELGNAHKYDYIVINDDLQTCSATVSNIIKSAEFAAKCSEQLINNLKKQVAGYLLKD